MANNLRPHPPCDYSRVVRKAGADTVEDCSRCQGISIHQAGLSRCQVHK